MGMYGFNFCRFIVVAGLFAAACDLQPKILSLPDDVGDFIASRYPALLADPETQPEIYNSAATDYGVYASPELYGAPRGDDYVTYASVDDYIVPPEQSYAPASLDAAPADVGGEIVANNQPATDDFLTVPEYNSQNQITVARGDTLYSISKKYNTSVDNLARANNLSAPYTLSVGQKLVLPSSTEIAAPTTPTPQPTQPVKPAAVATVAHTGTPTTTRVALSEIKVGAGDTLYSISRKYSVPVNDLAVMNNLTPPFTLSVGQVLKVPNLAGNARAAAVAPVQSATTKVATTTKPATTAKPITTPAPKTAAATTPAPTKTTTPKISSDPKKKLPAIGARSSSKFSWPVRGKILSQFGAKSGGLFNDGINIAATRGTAVNAAENGVVAYAGNEVKGMGNLIIVQHDGGWMTVYAHMDSLAAKRGARVSVGQKIGTVGATGKVDAPQLHFEIRKGTKAYNPSQY